MLELSWFANALKEIDCTDELRLMLFAVYAAMLIASTLQPQCSGRRTPNKGARATSEMVQKKADNSCVSLADVTVQLLILEILQVRGEILFTAEEDFDAIVPYLLDEAIQILKTLIPLTALHNVMDVKSLDQEWSIERALALQKRCVAYGVSCRQPPRFILDPIDGTKGYLRREQYAIGLSCLIRGIPSFAVMGCPSLSLPLNYSYCKSEDGFDGFNLLPKKTTKVLIMFAQVSQGAYAMNVGDRVIFEPLKLPLQPVFRAEQKLIVLSSRDSKHSDAAAACRLVKGLVSLKPESYGLLRCDSMVKFALLALGLGHVYLRLPHAAYAEKIWDIVTGALILTEAGGRVSHCDGSAINVGSTRELENRTGILSVAPSCVNLSTSLASMTYDE